MDKQVKELKVEITEQLSTVADLKLQQIENWRMERLNDARFFTGDKITESIISDYIDNPSSKILSEEILEWMNRIKKEKKYRNIYLFSADQKLLLSTKENADISSETISNVKKILNNNDFYMSDLYIDEKSGGISIDVLFYIHYKMALNNNVSKIPRAIVLMQLNPQDFLFPLIQKWPSSSPTAETLLVRREGENVLFLNELRHMKNSAMKLKRSIRETSLPAAIAVRGESNVSEGIDYRGVPVLAAMRKIPDTEWFLVSKVDQREIYSPLREKVLYIGFFTSMLVLITLLLLVLVWRQRHYDLMKSEYSAQLKNKTLMERIVYLTKHANDIIILADNKFRIIEANDRALETYRFSRDEIFNITLFDLYPEERRADLLNHLKKEGSDTGSIFESVNMKKNGSFFPVEISIKTISIENETYHQSIIRDITERKEHEISLQKEKEFIRTLLDNLTEGVVACDAGGNLVLFNRAAREWHGIDVMTLKPEEWADKYDLFEADGKTPLKMESIPLYRAYTGEHVVNAGMTIVAKGCSPRDILAYGDPFYDAEKNKLGAVAVMRDITEEKKAHEKIEKMNAELELMVADRTAQLEAANKELESFSYSVSHDLRAPLRSIDGFSLALAEEYESSLDDTGKDYLRRIRAASQKMGGLIDDMLKLAKINRTDMRKEVFDVSFMAESIFNEFKKEDPNRNVNINLTSGITINADRNLMEIALNNLIGNAWKFTAKKELVEITFGSYEKDGVKVIFIKDNGAGFDSKYKEKLFGAFQRLHGISEFSGTGVGLATVHRIIMRHGGEIWAEGVVGEGATFYFTL